MTRFDMHCRRALSPPVPVQREQGAVLVVALIFLVLLTILALTASSSSMLQLRMAGNLRVASQAQMSANSALRGVEWMLWTHTPRRVAQGFLCTDGQISADGCIVYNPGSPAYSSGGDVHDFHTRPGWIATGREYKGPGETVDYTAGGGFTGEEAKVAALAENPRYIIEDMGAVRPMGSGSQIESGTTGPNSGGPGIKPPHSYRITARATGGNSKTVRVVQSTFDAQPNG